MAHVAYALCGHGRGHLSRALAVAEALGEAGHAVSFIAGGAAHAALVRLGAPVLHVPALRQVMRRNRVRLLATARANLDRTWRAPAVVAALAERLRERRPDLLVADLEPFAPRAAARLGVPVVALSHQQVLTEARCDVPPALRLSWAATAAGVRLLTPPRPAHVVVPTFFFPPVRDPARATLVPPVLRRAVREAEARPGEHVLVYLNAPDGAAALLDAVAGGLGGAPAHVYLDGAPPPAAARSRWPGLTFRPPSFDGFADDLAACRAVVATGGFTLMAEALHLGKPVLALPNRGFFEQALNALYLRRLARGDAVLGRLPRAADVRTFLDRAADGAFARPPSASPAPRAPDGNGAGRAAVGCIERVLRAGPAGAGG